MIRKDASIARTCALALLMLGAALVSSPRVSAEPGTQPAADDWFAMSPEQFAKTEAAQRPLPWGEVDDRLLAAAILHETNRHRAEHNLPHVEHLPDLDKASAMHASDMAAGAWLAHENPDDPARREPVDRVKLTGLLPRFVAENIATQFGIQYEGGRQVYPLKQWGREGVSYQPRGRPIPPHTYHSFSRALVQGWMDSPPHRKNLLSPHPQFLGAACRPGQTEPDEQFRTFYCVQVFFAPMPQRQ